MAHTPNYDHTRTGLKAFYPHGSAREVYAALHCDYDIEPDDPREYTKEDVSDFPPRPQGLEQKAKFSGVSA